MKNKFFYSHLIETWDISLKLTEMDLSEDEKNHLTALAEANIHSTVIDTVLSELSKEDKKIFLQNLVSNNHEKTWEHLHGRIGKLEDKIINAVEKLKINLLMDLIKAKNISGGK